MEITEVRISPREKVKPALNPILKSYYRRKIKKVDSLGR